MTLIENEVTESGTADDNSVDASDTACTGPELGANENRCEIAANDADRPTDDEDAKEAADNFTLKVDVVADADNNDDTLPIIDDSKEDVCAATLLITGSDVGDCDNAFDPAADEPVDTDNITLPGDDGVLDGWDDANEASDNMRLTAKDVKNIDVVCSENDMNSMERPAITLIEKEVIDTSIGTDDGIDDDDNSDTNDTA